MSVGGAQILIKGIFETYQTPDHYLFVLRQSKDEIQVNHPNVIFSTSTSKYSFKALSELKNIIRTKDIDILHCYLLKSQIFGYLLKRFSFPKIKLIFHELGEIFMNDRFVFLTFMKQAQKKVDKFFAVSDATKAALHQKIGIPEQNISVLYNFVITENFKSEQIRIDIKNKRKELGISANEHVIGYAGRLSPEKGAVHLINALPRLKFPFKLLIAGTGAEKEMLEKRINQLNLSDKVIFLGFVKSMPETYALFDMLIIPSEHESFGLVAVEAQSAGIPVIASDIPGLNEVIDQKNGLLFEAKNPDDLAEKINYLIDNPKLKQQLIAGGKENIKKYEIENYYKKMTETYKILMQK